MVIASSGVGQGWIWRVLVLTLVGFTVSFNGCAYPAHSEVSDKQADETREAMDRIYAAIRVLLPLAVEIDGNGFARERSSAEEELENLQTGAADVFEHAADPLDRLLAGTLVDDYQRAWKAISEKNYESAAFFVRESVDECVSCHLEIARPHAAPLAAGFARLRPFQRLDARERMRLALATYQIEEALSIGEAALDDPSTPTHVLDGIALDYLIAGVRGARSPARVTKTIDRLSHHDGLSGSFRSDLRQWIEALNEVVRHPPAETLSSARAELAAAQQVGRGASGMRARAHAVIASRILSDWLASRDRSNEELAAGCFEMGRADQAIGRDYWPPKSDFYFECTIDHAPGTELARRAYDALRDDVLLGYSGSSGTHVPADELHRLERLKAIAEASPAFVRDPADRTQQSGRGSGRR